MCGNKKIASAAAVISHDLVSTLKLGT